MIPSFGLFLLSILMNAKKKKIGSVSKEPKHANNLNI